MSLVTRTLAAFTALAALAAVPAVAAGAGPAGMLTGAGPERADQAPASRPGLSLPAPAVLPPSSQSLAVGASFDGNYPLLGVSFAQGMAGGLELGGAGLFRHSRVDWPRSGGADASGGRYDADEFQAALHLGTPVSGQAPAGVALGAGFTKGYARTRLDDGRHSLARSRTRWAEVLAGTGVVAGARATICERYLHDVESRTDTHATAVGTESPVWNGASILGEVGVFLKNPLKWKAPWAAGVRLPASGQGFFIFVSNTLGFPVPDALAGTGSLVWHCRLSLSM